MTRTFTRFCLAAGLLTATLGATLPEDGTVPGGSFVVICPIEEMIDDGTLVLVERALREAKDAEAIIFAIDTPGGLVDAAGEVCDRIVNAQIPTIAFVHGMGAISAGSMISYSCDDIVMAPGSAIGASAVITMGPEGVDPAGEKYTSYVRAKFRALAEENGHNPAIAEAMVDQDIELRAARKEDGTLLVWNPEKPDAEAEALIAESGLATTSETAEAEEAENSERDREKSLLEQAIEAVDKEVPIPNELKEGLRKLAEPAEAGDAPTLRPGEDPAGRVVLAKGKLLTLTLDEAIDWGVVKSSAANVDDAMHVFGYQDMARLDITPTWSEELFKWLIHPSVSGILLLLGMGGLYLEVKTPGFGAPGIIGLTCLGLFFGARLVVGLADWIDLFLVVLGIGLILIEVFVLPGFGFVGAGGFIALMAGIYLSFTRVTIPTFSWEWDRVSDMGISMSIAVVGMIILAILAAKFLESSPMGKRLTLETAVDAASGYVVQGAADEALAGAVGVATTRLNPTGRGRFDGKTRQVVCRGDFLEEGTSIRIVRVEGNRLVVDRVEEKSA